jgi:nicotinamide phosphoribosyltransferase
MEGDNGSSNAHYEKTHTALKENELVGLLKEVNPRIETYIKENARRDQTSNAAFPEIRNLSNPTLLMKDGHFFPKVGGLPLSMAILTDSYKAGHAFQYPPGITSMVAYGECRGPLSETKLIKGNEGSPDKRIVFYGIRYIVENYIARPWTAWDVEIAAHFYSTHNSANTAYPFPKELFMKFVKENNGYLPVVIESLSEGSVIYPHVPVYQITTEFEYCPLITFLETILTHVWYPITVATLSRHAKQVIKSRFEQAGIDDKHPLVWLLNYKLHDFGFRGCTTVEQSVAGGVAHLLNFKGTDTMSAAFYAQYYLNEGKPIGESIPATEHSVMLSFGRDKTPFNGGTKNEYEAIENMIEQFGNGLFSCVMDTYDYYNTIFRLIPASYEKKKAKGGAMVLRPDSGEPKWVVMDALIAIECMLLSDPTVGDKIYEKLDAGQYLSFFIYGYSVIQGDGVNLVTIGEILDYVMEPSNRRTHIKNLSAGIVQHDGKGTPQSDYTDFKEILSVLYNGDTLKNDRIAYSPINCTFGMGGGLLQKVNRDTLKFATKLNFLHRDNKDIPVMKDPKTEPEKRSLPGKLKVIVNDKGYPVVYPKDSNITGQNLMRVVYNGYNKSLPFKGLNPEYLETFETIRARVEEQWNMLSEKNFDPLSKEICDLRDKISKRN